MDKHLPHLPHLPFWRKECKLGSYALSALESKVSTLRATEGGMFTAAPRKLRTSQSVGPISLVHCLRYGMDVHENSALSEKPCDDVCCHVGTISPDISCVKAFPCGSIILRHAERVHIQGIPGVAHIHF